MWLWRPVNRISRYKVFYLLITNVAPSISFMSLQIIVAFATSFVPSMEDSCFSVTTLFEQVKSRWHLQYQCNQCIQYTKHNWSQSHKYIRDGIVQFSHCLYVIIIVSVLYLFRELLEVVVTIVLLVFFAVDGDPPIIIDLDLCYLATGTHTHTHPQHWSYESSWTWTPITTGIALIEILKWVNLIIRITFPN